MLEITEIIKKKHEILLEADQLYFQNLALKRDDPRKDSCKAKIEALQAVAQALDELAEKLADLDYENRIYEELM